MTNKNDEMNLVISSNKVEEYFGINSNDYWYNNSMSYFIPIKGMKNINKYELISKDEVFLFLKQNFNMYNLENYEMYISCEAVYTYDVKDYFENVVFTERLDCKGWLVFIDPSTDANWSHTCQYWFIVNRKNILKEQNENWPPHKNIAMGKIDIREWEVE